MKIIKTNPSPKFTAPYSPTPLPTSLPTNPCDTSSTTSSSNVAFPCGVCLKSVNENHNAVLCDKCNTWIHIKCNYLNKVDLKKLENINETFYCINCVKEIFPFAKLNNNEFSTSVIKGVLNTENKNIFKPSQYQQNIFNHLNSSMNNNDAFTDQDSDEDLIAHSINCRYYGVSEFTNANFCSSRTFSILHYNIHSIERHIEEFRIHLQLFNFDFDIICISESKIVDGSEPKCDISIPNYQAPISTPTEGTKGGVLIYVKAGINFKPRNDLKIYKSKELESAFIEIINKNESNTIIGAMYRHPCMNESCLLIANESRRELVREISVF